MIRVIPYELIENLFGPFIAANFNKIFPTIVLIIFIIRKIRNAKKEEDWLTQAQKKNQNRFEYLNRNIAHTQKKWSPNGWYWDEKRQQWIAPDYTTEEHTKNWRWDDEKQLWINIEQENRKKRYREFRKGKEPTYEEWKADKKAEEKAHK